MRKIVMVTVAAAGALALSGCGGKQAGVFAHGSGPDEFAVSRQAPLVIPPDFAMVPPKPGAPRPQEADSSTQALQALFGGPAPRSAVENALTSQPGEVAAPAIRSQAADPGTTVVNKGPVTRDILAAPEGPGQDATASTPQ